MQESMVLRSRGLPDIARLHRNVKDPGSRVHRDIGGLRAAVRTAIGGAEARTIESAAGVVPVGTVVSVDRLQTEVLIFHGDGSVVCAVCDHHCHVLAWLPHILIVSAENPAA